MIRALIFDYFGVVRPEHGVRQTYADLGGDSITDESFLADTITAANYGMVDADHVFAQKLGVTVEVWKRAVAGQPYNDKYLLAYIKELRVQGYQTALLSNATGHALSGFFAAGEIDQYFDEAIASGDIGYAKPQPEIFLIMADKLRLQADECMMIDDQAANCEGAEMAGLRAIQYRSLTQLQKSLHAILPNPKN